MTDKPLADRLDKLLRRAVPLPEVALPVERLAYALGALRDEPETRARCDNFRTSLRAS